MTIIFLILISSLTFANSFKDIVEQASRSREWHTLLHYKRNIYFQIESQADGEGFFFSEVGKTNPKEELIATLEAFQDESREIGSTHPQCAFPARFKYIKKTFGISPKEIECKEYAWWRQNLPAKSATVIFASYYANNPSSIFGHTFLRINSSDKKNISDYGVDFSAFTNTDHGIEFAVRGIFGGYTGHFNLKPYYMKMNEYIENENRDLWEYDLNLNEEQIDRLLAHLWELQRNTYFDYYFFRENCSYQLLTLLESANPEWKLSDGFHLETIPIDTIKVLMDTKNAVGEVHYRPAFKRNVAQRLDSLDSQERTKLRKLIKEDISPEEVSSAKVLEAAIASLRYERFEEKKFTKEQEDLLKRILIRRAKVGGKIEYPDVKETLPLDKLRPDLSHNSQKYSFSYGNNSSFGRYGEITLRASLHDLLDSDIGYPKNSQIEMSKWKFRSQGTNNLYLEELKYAEAFSLFPINKDEFKWSWRISGKSYRINDGGCDRCLSHHFRTGFGLSSNFSDQLDLYTLISLNAEAARRLYRGHRVAPSAGAGAIWTISEMIKLQYDFEFAHDLTRAEHMRDNRLIHEAALAVGFKQLHELRVTGKSWSTIKNQNPIEEIQLSYSFYH